MKSHRMMTEKERKAMNNEIRRQIGTWTEKLGKELYTMIAYSLHHKLGFGEKRITEFLIDMEDNLEALIKWYQMEDDAPWLCGEKLKEDSIDMDAVCEKVKKNGKCNIL